MEIAKWLAQTTAGEVMVKEVVTLRPDDSLAHAADVLLSQQISGAPVVDTKNVCVGVLAVSDLIRAEGKVEAEQEQIADSNFFNSELLLPSRIYADRLEQLRDKILPVSEQPIQRFMVSDIVSVSKDESLATIVKNVVDAHVHRVLVVNSDRQLQGLVSTIDVLAALLRASR